MRASSRLWLLMCAAFGSLSCIGGPISDFPRGGKGTEGASDDDEDSSPSDEGANNGGDDDVGKGDDDTSEPTSPPSGGGKRDAGTVGGGKAPMSDGGASTPSLDAGTTTPPSGDSSDGGSDGGERGASCTPTSDARSYGGCYGSYCDQNERSLAGAAEPESACSSDHDLALACDGELARVVLDCAQRQVLSIGMGRSVLACAKRATTLADASEDCVGCYVDEVVCSLRNCLVACFDPDSSECSACRAKSCASEFSACSGLPVPNADTTAAGDGGITRDAGRDRD